MSAPDALQPFHLATPSERDRRVRKVLVAAWALYRKGENSLVGSVQHAAKGAVEGPYALMQLRGVLLTLNLDHWASHPTRSRTDVHKLFRKAIARLTPHRGGWNASTPRAEAR